MTVAVCDAEDDAGGSGPGCAGSSCLPGFPADPKGAVDDEAFADEQARTGEPSSRITFCPGNVAAVDPEAFADDEARTGEPSSCFTLCSGNVGAVDREAFAADEARTGEPSSSFSFCCGDAVAVYGDAGVANEAGSFSILIFGFFGEASSSLTLRFGGVAAEELADPAAPFTLLVLATGRSGLRAGLLMLSRRRLAAGRSGVLGCF